MLQRSNAQPTPVGGHGSTCCGHSGYGMPRMLFVYISPLMSSTMAPTLRVCSAPAMFHKQPASKCTLLWPGMYTT